MKQLILATAALFVLSTAVANNVSDGSATRTVTTAQTAPSTDPSLQAAARNVSLWKDHAHAAASTPLSRPL
jgi:hypothetical protein